MKWIYSNELIDYQDSFAQMKKYVELEQEVIWGLQHNLVYTAGRSANPFDLINTKAIPVYETDRGGQYTHHGPGQLVVYCMLNLSMYRNDIRFFIESLEKWIQRSLKELGCETERFEERRGLWIKDKKIAALGIKISKGKSYHGFSINVNNDLAPFHGIVPCGLKDYFVTSLKDQKINTTCKEVWSVLQNHF
jgi:lipoyl(octanoyl) transferase